MATAVLDLDFNNLPPKIDGLSGYSNAFILLRYRTKPVGKLTVPVINNQVNIHEYIDDFIEEGGSVLLDRWVEETLNPDSPCEIKPLVSVSVVVCTRNRTTDLKLCLDSLMKLPDQGQEYIVIDNAPSDSRTRELVQLYPNVRYVLEEIPGLNVARNRALKEANHDIVAFTDDDAMPDINWLSGLLKNFDHPLVMCVAGLTMPYELETDAQEAFELFSPFGKGFQMKYFKGDSNPTLSAGHIGAGANMALRKRVIEKVGFFDEALDAGTITKSGGDHEYFVRILLRGYHIIYEPEALSWHRHRRTWKELQNTIRGYGTGIYAYWTRMFFIEHEFSVGIQAYSWFVNNQFPDLLRAFLGRPGSKSLKLLICEWQGCVLGPWVYFISLIKIKRR